MTVGNSTPGIMTSCLPGADSGGSQGSAGLASLNESAGTLGSNSVNASPVLSPNDQAGVGSNTANGLSFSASSLCSSAVTSAASALGAAGMTLSSPVGSTDSSNNNNHLSAAAAAAAAAAGQLNLTDCDPARFASLPYPRLSAGGLGSMYSAAAAAATYPSNDQNPYPSIAMADNSFYGSLVRLQSVIYQSLGSSLVLFHSVRVKPSSCDLTSFSECVGES